MRWGTWQAHDRRERLRLFLSKLDETALQALTAKASIEDEVACSASPHSAPPSLRALPRPVPSSLSNPPSSRALPCPARPVSVRTRALTRPHRVFCWPGESGAGGRVLHGGHGRAAGGAHVFARVLAAACPRSPRARAHRGAPPAGGRDAAPKGRRQPRQGAFFWISLLAGPGVFVLRCCSLLPAPLIPSLLCLFHAYRAFRLRDRSLATTGRWRTVP